MVDTAARQRWMRLLSLSDLRHLERGWQNLPQKPTFSWIRAPETGLVLLRARVGGTGLRFNFGEVTVTRCAVSLCDKIIGASYVRGRDHRHAELAALFDGLLQDPEDNDRVATQILAPIEEQLTRERAARWADVTATKVDFFARSST